MPSLLDTLKRLTAGAVLITVAVIASSAARAQNTPATPTTPAATQADTKLSQGQLEQLVAPIALYPDALLSQVMMASTYPLEVIEAARWSQANPDVTGQALQDAMQKQTWDPSVKGLTATPQVLQMMSQKLDWTQQLGDAVLAQQQDVLAAVQQLRARADANGTLKSTPQQKVTKRAPPANAPSGSTQQVIVIEPATPDMYYVPIYDPTVVYGAWQWPAYEPFYWYPSDWVASNAFSFAAGVVVGAAIWGSVDWWRRSVHVNVNRYNQFNRTNITNNKWAHDGRHRGNVPYKNVAIAQQFNQTNRNVERQNLQRELDKRNKAGQGKDQGKNQGKNEARNRTDNQGKDRAKDHAKNDGKNKGNDQGKDQAKNRAKGDGKNAHAKKDGQHAKKDGNRARQDHANRERANKNHANRANANRNHVNRARAEGARRAQQPHINRQAMQRHGGAHAQVRAAGGMRHAGGGHGGRRR